MNVQDLSDHIFRKSGQHVVELCCLVHDVAQPEMALHEDAAATGWACQIGSSLMSLGVMSNHPAKEQGPNPRYPLFKHGITTEEYTYST
jgi:hypothetical protein